MPYRDDQLRLLRYFHKLLLTKEKEELLYLSKQWSNLAKNLEELIDELSNISAHTKTQLYKIQLYREFLNEAKNQTDKFALEASKVITEYQKFYALAGIKSTALSIGLSNQLPITALNTMFGMTKEGTPLYELLKQSYPDSMIKITNTLIESTALGRNPEKTARLIKEAMNDNLTRALRVARTEQMNCFREASVLQMEQSKVVKGFELLAEDDACEICLSYTGKIYSFDERPDLHPNCRCAFIPTL